VEWRYSSLLGRKYDGQIFSISEMPGKIKSKAKEVLRRKRIERVNLTRIMPKDTGYVLGELIFLLQILTVKRPSKSQSQTI
jgi:hypothetical protein